MQLCLLLVAELLFRQDDFDILEDNREASNPVDSNGQHQSLIL